MPLVTHPDEGKVLACPNCDRAGGFQRRLENPRSTRRKDDKEFRCYNCLTSFDEPVRREARSPTDGKGNLSDAGEALMKTDPDEFEAVIGDV